MMYYERLQHELGKVPVVPDGCHAVRFALPDDADEADHIIEESMKWRFRLDDVEEFIEQHPRDNLPPLEIPKTSPAKELIQEVRLEGEPTHQQRSDRPSPESFELLRKAGAEAELLYIYVKKGLQHKIGDDDVDETISGKMRLRYSSTGTGKTGRS
jgi:hypothetical protein